MFRVSQLNATHKKNLSSISCERINSMGNDFAIKRKKRRKNVTMTRIEKKNTEYTQNEIKLMMKIL